jgi:hypothetical protein
MSIDPVIFQIVFYLVSPVITFLAVATAYLALYRQSKPSVMLHYEPSNDAGSVIDLVIGNYGGGTAREVSFSAPIPIRCWGIENPDKVNEEDFLQINIPALAPGKTLRYQAGQYGGLLSQIGEGMPITASYKYKSPLKFEKKGEDLSVLDLRYMAQMHSGNSPAYDLADAMKGRNNTIFIQTNRSLASISKSLNAIASSLSAKNDPEK